jgi:hypothetical protein
MSWPPTHCDMLRDLYGSSEGAMPDRLGVWQPAADRDIPVYDQECAQPLLDAGMAHRLNIPGCKGAYCLTNKGSEAAEMLLCNRTFGRFAMPDWLMNEIAGPKAA